MSLKKKIAEGIVAFATLILASERPTGEKGLLVADLAKVRDGLREDRT